MIQIHILYLYFKYTFEVTYLTNYSIKLYFTDNNYVCLLIN